MYYKHELILIVGSLKTEIQKFMYITELNLIFKMFFCLISL